MSRALCAALLLTCIGCKTLVSNTSIGTPYIQQRSESCAYTGYCYGLSFNGKYEFGMSAMCPGTQRVTVRVTSMKRTYDDGSMEYVDDDEILSRDTECR